MKNKKYITLGFASAGIAITLFLSSTVIASSTEETKKTELSRLQSFAKFTKVISIVEQYNVDNVSIEDLMDKALQGMLVNLDAHSSYLSKDAYKKLKAIAKEHQVMCISHLPNIAANADHNYFISKDVNNNRTKTKIRLLNENEVIEEIARISSGEINEVSLKYATELRNKKAS